MGGRSLDVAKAASRLDLSEQHVRRLIREGKLRAVNIGLGDVRPTYRIPEDELIAYMQNQEAGLHGRIHHR